MVRDRRSVEGRPPPSPWSDDGKIPWGDPAFSERMLREHLSQQHDRASRRFEIVDEHVAWLHEAVLGGQPGRILDLGCGPGFYTSRLAALGHRCVGVDISPSSIAYAEEQAKQSALDCRYACRDVREVPIEGDFDLVLMLFGEINTFAPDDLKRVFATARSALASRGRIVVELHRDAFVRDLARGEPGWSSHERGVFADSPHDVYRECFWFEEERVSVERFTVFEAGGAETTYHSTTGAYTEDDIARLLEAEGFRVKLRVPCLTGRQEPVDPDLHVLVAELGGETP